MDVLESKVLVLNKAYSPIRMTTVREAFCKITSEAAEIISIEDGAYANYDFLSWAEVSEYKQLLIDENIDVDGDVDWVNTPSLQLLAPRVIRMLSYEKAPRYQLRLTRKNVYDRDGHVCQYCGKKFGTDELNIDHVTPRSKGGKNTWTNLVCSCIKCNRKKKDDTCKEAGMKLLRKPFKPRPSFNLRVPHNSKRYSDWDHFISDIYYNVPLVE